jgi:hypothetical protein
MAKFNDKKESTNVKKVAPGVITLMLQHRKVLKEVLKDEEKLYIFSGMEDAYGELADVINRIEDILDALGVTYGEV